MPFFTCLCVYDDGVRISLLSEKITAYIRSNLNVTTHKQKYFKCYDTQTKKERKKEKRQSDTLVDSYERIIHIKHTNTHTTTTT